MGRIIANQVGCAIVNAMADFRVTMKVLLAFYLFLIIQPSQAASFSGKVLAVIDGDTIVVAAGKKEKAKIRLVGIDAPESEQSMGKESKKALSAMVSGKQVTVRWEKKDDYGRFIGDIYVGKLWVNQRMVALGWAWHYKNYSKDKRLAEAQKTAKEDLKGIWVDKTALPPWDWRKRNKQPSRNASSPKDKRRSLRNRPLIK